MVVAAALLGGRLCSFDCLGCGRARRFGLLGGGGDRRPLARLQGGLRARLIERGDRVDLLIDLAPGERQDGAGRSSCARHAPGSSRTPRRSPA